jgi:hypothetical protein
LGQIDLQVDNAYEIEFWKRLSNGWLFFQRFFASSSVASNSL